MAEFNPGLNPAPTDVQLAKFRRHKAAGTSPGNPKWYKSQRITPFKFKAGLPAKLPHYETGTEWMAAHALTHATKYRPAVIHYVDGTMREVFGKSIN